MDFQVCQDVKFVEWKTIRFQGDVFRYQAEDEREVCGDEADTRDSARESFDRIISGLSHCETNDSRCVSATPVGEPISYQVLGFWEAIAEFLGEGGQRMAESSPVMLD